MLDIKILERFLICLKVTSSDFRQLLQGHSLGVSDSRSSFIQEDGLYQKLKIPLDSVGYFPSPALSLENYAGFRSRPVYIFICLAFLQVNYISDVLSWFLLRYFCMTSTWPSIFRRVDSL